MVTRFVILAAPRTGSNLLCTLLNSHPEILCHHELFNPQGIFTAQGFQGPAIQQASLAARDEAPLEFLNLAWSLDQGNRSVGFKWTRGQNERVLNHVLDTQEIQKIVLRRRNRVKTYVSDLIARKTNQWEVYNPRELAFPRPQVAVDAKALRQHVEQNQQFYSRLENTLKQTRQEYLELTYELLLTAGEQSRVLDFLHPTRCRVPLTPSSVKQNPMDLRQSIANYDELLTQLSGCELAAELQDASL